jgi:hypothetical protein
MTTEEMTTQIADRVAHDPRWAQRAIVALYNYQTPDEQQSEMTKHNNAVGFNGVDAPLLSSFADQIIRGRTLTERQLVYAYRKLPKYAKQLARIAADKIGS